MRSLRLLGLLFLFCGAARADSEALTWTQFLAQAKAGEKIRFWGEIQPRFSFESGSFTTFILRPGIGWQFNPRFSLWTGYAWAPQLNPFRDEHRAWAQTIYAGGFGDTFLTHRLRLETRFISGLFDTVFRLRYQARFAVPVSTQVPVQVVVYDELFLNLYGSGPAILGGFDQNRLFLGANYRFSPAWALDLGYMWNAIRRPLTENKSNQVVMLSVFYNLDFTNTASAP